MNEHSAFKLLELSIRKKFKYTHEAYMIKKIDPLIPRILANIYVNYINLITKNVMELAYNSSRGTVNIIDLIYCFEKMGIDASSLIEFSKFDCLEYPPEKYFKSQLLGNFTY